MEGRFYFRVPLYRGGDFDSFNYLSVGTELFFINPKLTYKKFEQCTGIKDINDKFIYEGDIIDAIIPLNMRPDLRIRHVIVFQKGAFGSIDKGLFGPLCNYGYNCNFEILGNIHENPELLED